MLKQRIDLLIVIFQNKMNKGGKGHKGELLRSLGSRSPGLFRKFGGINAGGGIRRRFRNSLLGSWIFPKISKAKIISMMRAGILCG
jgi:hypothetical protein